MAAKKIAAKKIAAKKIAAKKTARSTLKRIDTAEHFTEVIGESVRVGCLPGIRQFVDNQGGVPARATNQNPRQWRLVHDDETTFVVSICAIPAPVNWIFSPTRTAASTTRIPTGTTIATMSQASAIYTVEDLYNEIGCAVRAGLLPGIVEVTDHQGSVPARGTPHNRRTIRLILSNDTTLIISTYTVAPPVTRYISPAPRLPRP